MLLRVGLRRFFRVVSGVMKVARGRVRVVRRRLVIAGLVMFACFSMMASSVLVMLGRRGMVLCCFLRHKFLLEGLSLRRNAPQSIGHARHIKLSYIAKPPAFGESPYA